MDSAAKRLQDALLKVDRAAFIRVAKAAGMDPLVVGQAFGGKTVPALTYMRLCALCAIDATTGEPSDDPQYPHHIQWAAIGAFLTAKRADGQMTWEQMAVDSGIGRNVLSEASHKSVVGTESFLAICAYLSRRPEVFLWFMDPDVSRETLGRKCGEALQPEVRS